MKADAVGARGIVVHKAEIVLASCSQLSPATKLIKAFWNRPGRVCGVSLIQSPGASIRIYRKAFAIELGRLIETKDSRPSIICVSCKVPEGILFLPWGSYLSLYSATFDLVLDPVEGEFCTEKLKEPSRYRCCYERLKVQKIQIRLVIDFPTRLIW
jgi:hypothetical protein